jgi:hypothetical protein
VRGPPGRSARRAGLALAAVALGLGRCATVPPPPPPAAPVPAGQVAELVRRWAAEWEAFPGLRAAVDLAIRNRRGNERVAALLLVAPTALRVEVTTPFGLPALVATAGADEITIYRVLERRAHTGAPSPAAVARWLGVPLPPQTLIRLLVGNVPTPADPAAIAVESTPTPHLTWTGEEGRYRLWVAADGRPARLLLEAVGGDRLAADFRWSAGAGLAELRVEAPARGAELAVRYLSAEYAENPPEAFRLVLPRDVPVQRLD